MKFFFSLMASFMLLNAKGQQAYKAGNIVADFMFSKVLNNSMSSPSLNQLKNELTIIDFFGTWCIPCIKALPHLTALESKFPGKVTIILVSNEDEGSLAKFIAARSPFPFPVVVDNENRFISLFQPPSYPYTIVIDKPGKIIAVTDAASLTETDLNKWFIQEIGDPATESVIPTMPPGIISKNLKSSNLLVELSQQFIYAAKTGDVTDSIISALKSISYNDLKVKLQSDEEKKAFWINLYNGYTQVNLKRDPEKYKSRGKFFKSKQIEVGGKMFSLDDIEHGILRHSKIKWSLGYLNKIFPGKTEKELRVKHLDYRIHFALNCGAKSCPPIAFYNPENLNPQLDIATKSYLTGEAEYDEKKNVVLIPALMNWFRGDFGGKKGMKQLLQKINVIPGGSNPRIKFKKYDWNLFLNHYKTDI
ncbi:MAG: DUF547 domain-containing protein [Ginsengibacter sp.]